jgi:hypothetical protein
MLNPKMTHYFYQKDGSVYGPFTKEEIISMGLPNDIYVWRKGLDSWRQLNKLAEFKNSKPRKHLILTLSIIFTVIIGVILSVYVVNHISKTDSSDVVDEHLLVELNKDLPMDIGSLGTLVSITSSGNIVNYNILVDGDKSIIDFYRSKSESFKTIFLLGLCSVEGQGYDMHSGAYALAENEVCMRLNIKNAYNDCTSILITGDEALKFISLYKKSPIEAVRESLEIECNLYNLTSAETIESIFNAEGIALNSCSIENTSVVFEYVVDESVYDLDLLKLQFKDSMVIETLLGEWTQDIDMLQLINRICIANSSITIKYRGAKTNRIVTMHIPYDLMKSYSTYPYFKK